MPKAEPAKRLVEPELEPAFEPVPGAWALLTGGVVLISSVAILFIAAYGLKHSHFLQDIAPVFLKRALER